MGKNIFKSFKQAGFQATKTFNADHLPESLKFINGNGKVMVHPCIIDGQQTFVYEKGLADKNPEVYRRLLKFSESSGYALLEDRRSDFIEGVKRVKNKHCANVISIMVLTASLLSQNVEANTVDAVSSDYLPTSSSQTLISDMFNLDSDISEKELVSGLLNWINNHSPFSYEVSDLPKINKVSAVEITKVAFGGKLPKAVDAESLNIYGLYNFNEKAIYLLDSLDLNSEKGRGILLHELVHYLQYQIGDDKNVECKNELESMAYMLEAKYLDMHDHSHNLNSGLIKQLSDCH